jgi:hypothetical protein
MGGESNLELIKIYKKSLKEDILQENKSTLVPRVQLLFIEFPLKESQSLIKENFGVKMLHI